HRPGDLRRALPRRRALRDARVPLPAPGRRRVRGGGGARRRVGARLDLAAGPRSPRRVSETTAQRRLTAADLWAIPRVGTPAPAPDGSFLVVGVTTYASDGDEAKERLYLVPTTGERLPRPLTAPDVSSSQPAVSPDGRRLAFVRKPAGG